ncbi:MAG: helix-turn-helix transcriptional regulator [Rhodobacter sp.]|nr:helix-turn-helix transcriptional regulator [Rhodobacter sp.]
MARAEQRDHSWNLQAVGADPVPGQVGSAQFSAALEFVGQFALAASNRLTVASALASLQALTGARSVELVRVSDRTGRSRPIAHAGREWTHAHKANSATQNPAGGRKVRSAGSQGISPCSATCVILGRYRTESDVLRLEFDTEPEEDVAFVLRCISDAAAKIWSQREPGLASALIIDEARNSKTRAGKGREAAILGPDNVFGLSRAEFRVCNLLRKGLKPNQIAEELGISITTVRSHLSSIYAKTETSGQLGVLHKLSHDTAVIRRENNQRGSTHRSNSGDKVR